ncbi:MAG: hypothetical protein H5U17_09665 [Defluviimonas sp.]|nr:hypothetical protein [Defluviimonas sp.]
MVFLIHQEIAPPSSFHQLREPSTLSIYDLCFVASLPWDEKPARVFD